MSEDARLAEYEALWKNDAKDYVIVSLRGSDLKGSVIFNTRVRSAVVIEDDDIAVEVMERMLAHGVQRVEKLPK